MVPVRGPVYKVYIAKCHNTQEESNLPAGGCWIGQVEFGSKFSTSARGASAHA